MSSGLATANLTVQAPTGIETTITATTYTLGIVDHYVSFGAGATDQVPGQCRLPRR